MHRYYTFFRLFVLAGFFLGGIVLSNKPAFADDPAPSQTPAPTETPKATPGQIEKPEFIRVPAAAYGMNYVPDQVVVGLADGYSPDEAATCLGESAFVGMEVGPDSAILHIQPGTVAESLEKLRSCPSVSQVEPSYMVYTADTIPSDPSWLSQYYLTTIDAPEGWDYTTGASFITIAIIDSGAALNHPDLAGKIVAGYDFVNDDNDPQDDFGHGTHVAGIAAAASNNAVGVAGVSWGAQIMPIKVLASNGSGTYPIVAAGVRWAVDHGAQIINLSLGASSESFVLQEAIDYAIANGVVVIAAAGNAGSGSVFFPARYWPVIAVSATDENNIKAGFSNYGPEIDFTAPGANIYNLSPDGYRYRSGTSMAAPQVAGLAALLMSIPGNRGNIYEQIKQGTLDLGDAGWDDFYGYGLIQAGDSIVAAISALSTPTPTPTSTPTQTATPTMTPTLSENPPTSTPTIGGQTGQVFPVFPTWTPRAALPTGTITGSPTRQPATPTRSVIPPAEPTPNAVSQQTSTPEQSPDQTDYRFLLYSGACCILIGVVFLGVYLIIKREVAR